MRAAVVAVCALAVLATGAPRLVALAVLFLTLRVFASAAALLFLQVIAGLRVFNRVNTFGAAAAQRVAGETVLEAVAVALGALITDTVALDLAFS